MLTCVIKSPEIILFIYSHILIVMAVSILSKQRVLDFAILSRNIISPQKDESNTIELDTIPLQSEEFDAMFYSRKNNRFNIIENIYDGYVTLGVTDPFSLEGKTVKGNPFNLVSSVISFYEHDLGVTYHNWEFTTIIKVKKALQGLKNIFDFYRYATAMTRSELINAIFDEGGIVNGVHTHILRLQLLITTTDTRFKPIRIIIPYSVNLKPGKLFVPNYLYILSQLIRNEIMPDFTQPFILQGCEWADERNIDKIVKTRSERRARSTYTDMYMNVIDQLNAIPNYQFKLLALDSLAIVDRGKVLCNQNKALAQTIETLRTELDECNRPRPRMAALITTYAEIKDVTIDSTYIYYIRDYGKPYMGVFEADKIAEIRKKYSLCGT